MAGVTDSSERRQRRSRKSKTLRFEVELLQAAKSGRVDSVEEWITSNPQIINCRERNGNESTPLHLASGYNKISVVKYLLQNGAEIDLKDKNGRTPLHSACCFGHFDVALLLIQLGAEIDAEDERGFTPLRHAASRKNPNIVQILLKYGANPLNDSELNNRRFGLILSVKRGDLKRTMTLINKDDLHSNVRQKDGKEGSLLHVAVSGNDIEMMEYLLKQGTEVNFKDAEGRTPLHLAATECQLELQSLHKLVEESADVNARNHRLLTPLHEAAMGCRADVCIFLLSHGANPFLEDATRKTAIGMTSAEHIKYILKEAMINYSCSSSSDLEVPEQEGTEHLNELLSDEDGTESVGNEVITEQVRNEDGAESEGNEQGTGIMMPSGILLALPTPELQIEEGEIENESSGLKEVIEEEMQLSMGSQRFHFIQIQRFMNRQLWKRYISRRQNVAEENQNEPNERMLFHGSSEWESILSTGFDERYAKTNGMFGPGIYFADRSVKSNSYVCNTGCLEHNEKFCCVCPRYMLLCRVTLGNSSTQLSAVKLPHGIPGDFHSISAQPSPGLLKYPEYVIHRGEQAYPEYLITYKFDGIV